LVKPVAVRGTRGAWFRNWPLVSLDGSTFNVVDEKANEDAFSLPGASRGSSAYPKIRFVSLVENGTHVLFGNQMDGYQTGEITIAKAVLPHLKENMLCLADLQFFGLQLRQRASGTGAAGPGRVQYEVPPERGAGSRASRLQAEPRSLRGRPRERASGQGGRLR
jgi:hypothetical protein